MSEKNKAILEAANSAVAEGDYEGFLAFCADDSEWTFVGDQTLKGIEAIRQWMTTAYVDGPPKLTVTNLIAEGDFVTAVGEVTSMGENGEEILSDYCDIWKFRDGKMVGLTAFVIEPKNE